jgi:hypothetical protein
MKLSPCETITDMKQFMEWHGSFVKAYEGKKIAGPYRERLEKAKQIINQSK